MIKTFHTPQKCIICGTVFIPHGVRNKHCSLACVFWSKVDRKTPTECWPWLGAKSKDNGYGIFRRNSIQYKAHRIAYSLYVGEFINNDSRKSYHGLCVLHSCDNPTCCNPAHLFTGTHEDNMQDMIKKKRRNYQGEKNPAAKLTKDQVAKIRNYLAKGIPARQVARMYGVGATTIYHIQHNETWME